MATVDPVAGMRGTPIRSRSTVPARSDGVMVRAGPEPRRLTELGSRNGSRIEVVQTCRPDRAIRHALDKRTVTDIYVGWTQPPSPPVQPASGYRLTSATGSNRHRGHPHHPTAAPRCFLPREGRTRRGSGRCRDRASGADGAAVPCTLGAFCSGHRGPGGCASGGGPTGPVAPVLWRRDADPGRGH